MQENWKDIKGYEQSYQVSNLGRVKSLSRTIMKSNNTIMYVKERILKTRRHNNGYYMVTLYKNQTPKLCTIHRLVAKAFIDNPENKSTVNHLDGDKLNNHVDNLEWCTQQENITHSNRPGLTKNKVAVNQYDLDGNFIQKFESVRSAGKTLKINTSHIGSVCRGNRNQTGGYIWRYASERNS